MKVLWITEFFPGSDQGEITGGVESRCFFVSKYLREKGLELKIIARRTTGSVWETADARTIPGRFIFVWKAVFAALFSHFDVIEGSNFITYPPAWLVGTIKRKPVVFWYADVFIGRWQKEAGWVTGAILELWERGCLLLPGVKYIAISLETKKKLVAYGVAEEKIKVINCGVDRRELAAIKVPTKKTVDVVCVSRLLKYKRVEDLVRALMMLETVGGLIIGRGPELASLKKLAVRKDIQFAGYIPTYKDVLSAMAGAKIFCLPSVLEGFGITTVEAAGLGLPFVVADTPINREILGKSGAGLFFESKNYSDLAEKINAVLKNQVMYNNFTRKALLLAQRYDWEKIAMQTKNYYEDLYPH